MQIAAEVAPHSTGHQSTIANLNQTPPMELGYPTSVSHIKSHFNHGQTYHTQRKRLQTCHSTEPEKPEIFGERNHTMV